MIGSGCCGRSDLVAPVVAAHDEAQVVLHSDLFRLPGSTAGEFLPFPE